jgi:NAD(P)-dependent dehydrogenase (short-subunit alcohol dehydrogenase family)
MSSWDARHRKQMLSAATAQRPIPRPGTADEVASAILLLIKNDFVTGTMVDVDGGWLLS